MDSPTCKGIGPIGGLSLPPPQTDTGGRAKPRLSIFSRLALGSLAIVLVTAGVNLYALVQLRQLTALSTQLVSYHYPAIEGAKRLVSSLYAQLRSAKQYSVVPDPEFVTYFKEEGREFQRVLTKVREAETSLLAKELLDEVERLQGEYRQDFLNRVDTGEAAAQTVPAEALRGGDSLVDRIEAGLQAFIHFHEDKVSRGVTDSSVSSAHAEAAIKQLILLAVLVGLVFAGVASYSILRPLRRLQMHMREIGQGKFGTTGDLEAPSELAELVETVNWMAARLQEFDDMKSEFLAHVSHELRTPLASIQEGTQLLLDQIPGPLTEEQRVTVRIMADSSRRLIHLISTLLDLSKMEAGMMEYRIVLTDLRSVAQTSVNKVRLLAEGKQVQMIMEVPEEEIRVPADGARIEQVMDNLLSNAVKFSPRGGVVLLHMQPDDQDGILQVSVSDTGPGIAPEDLPHLFERFYQGRKQTGSGLAGSGLGLALAKKVVEAHNGRIWVESEPRKGTTVHFVLPLLGRSEAR